MRHMLPAVVASIGLCLPAAAFAAQPAAAAAKANAELDQCTNNQVSPPAPQPCLGSSTAAASVAISGISGGAKTSYKNWSNGNSNGSKSHWREGEFVAYRTVLSGLASGAHTLTFSYDTVDSGGHSFDYLGSYDATETTSAATTSSNGTTIYADNNSPCQDLVNAGQMTQSQCGSAYNASGQQTSPAKPVATTATPSENFGSTGGEQGCGGSHGTFSGTQQAGTIGLFGPAGSTIGPATIGTGKDSVLSGNGVCTTTVTLKFSIPSALSSSQSIVIAWSGHVASQKDWGTGDTASIIGGAHYHMTLATLDSTSAAQDLNLGSTSIFFTPAVATTIDLNGTACSGSPCSVPLGKTVNDSATLTGAYSLATGTVTYSLFPNGTCSGTATSTQTVTVANAAAPNSSSFTPSAGSYSYQATYSGDTQDIAPPASSCEPFSVAKASSTTAATVIDATTGKAWDNTEAVGSSAYDTATVGAGGGFTPTGTVTYTYFTSPDCSTGGSVNKVVTLNPDGSVPNSATVGPLAAGSYSFQATYSGDSNYTGSTSPCKAFTAGKGGSTTVATVTDAGTGKPWANTEAAGSSAYDTATVAASGGVTATGTVTYTYFTSPDCSTGGSVNKVVTLNPDGSVPNSGTVGPLAAGSYSFQATYSGDSNYNGSTSACQPFTAGQAGSTTAATVTDAGTGKAWDNTEPAGASAYDTATVAASGGFTATGTVTYTYFTSPDCSTGGSVNKVVTLNSDGSVPNSATVGPLAAGSYSFQATYSGDSNYNGSTSACQPFTAGQAGSTTAGTVTDAGTGKAWDNSEAAGASAYDSATVAASGGFTATGTVTYTYFTSPDCSTGGSVNKVVTLNSDGSVPNSATVGPLAAGSYSFQATYSGDSNYNGSTGPCQAFTAGQAGSTTAAAVFDAATNKAWDSTEAAGASAYDTATVAASGGFTATGTVTYTYFTSPDCSTGGSVNKVVTLNSDGSVPNSATVGPLAAGSYSFQATYSGDSNYNGSTSSCQAFTVHAPKTVVSLTFDDGNLDQYTNALPILQQYGMHGTFYIVTGYINNLSGYMTVPELQAIYNAGNEIAGHTVLHPYLTHLSSDEATREVCSGRDTLLNWGFPVTDFAYPYSDNNAAVQSLVQQCGYNSARLSEDLKGPYSCLSGCPLTESNPPANPYAIKTPDSLQDNWTLSDLENLVTNAESQGGWLPIVFHHICDNDCDQYSISPANFSAFLAWLQNQNVSVQTVNQVIGGPVNPPVSAPQVQPAAPGVNGVANPSLETADTFNTGFPYCWRASATGTNDASFSETSNAHTGSVAETITINNYTSGDAKLITVQDLGQCAPGAVPGDAYVASAWYKSTTPTRLVFYYRDTNGGWHFWTQSPQFAASSSWTQATWSPPAVPSGATALSFGLNIQAAGTLTTDDYSLVDTGGPPASPSVSLTGPSAGSTLTGPVTFTANTSSSIGIARVDYLVNGAVVATSNSAPYSATWDSSTVGDGPVTITARATDIDGNQTTSSGVSATISNAASRGGNMLANASLETSANGTLPDCWQLGGSGTNTFTWTRTSNAHTGNWAENVAITAYTSGDRKLVTSQGANACSPRVNAGSTYNLGGWYESNQSARIVAYYLNSSGSWVFWTQSPAFAASSTWAHATWTTPAVPAGATALSFGINLANVGSLTTDDYTMTGN